MKYGTADPGTFFAWQALTAASSVPAQRRAALGRADTPPAETPPATADGTDELAALRRQDAAAFARLVASHQRVVLSVAQSLGFAGVNLDEAAADVFAEVYEALPGFEGRASLSTWIYRIALRLLWKRREREARRAAAPLPEDAVAAGQPMPGDAIEADETSRRIWQAVAALDPRQATAVELHYRQGWPLEEIARAMSCPVNTVKTHLYRAREALRNDATVRELRT